MTEKDKLLEKAKRNYPKGTEYNSAYSGNNKTCSGGLYYNNGDIQDSNTNYVYYSGQWSKILKSSPSIELLHSSSLYIF